jgi:hypothetical protein
MITKSPIEPDELAILALQRFSTGADVHESNGLIYSYRLHCAFGNVGDAGAKWTMYRRARELMRRHDRA